jgi:hypothetical protein
MVEQMQKEMDAQAAADERLLRERVRATGELHQRLLNEYIEKFGTPPMAINLSNPVEGAQFCAVPDEQDASDRQIRADLSDASYEDRDPNRAYYDEDQLSNLHGDGDACNAQDSIESFLDAEEQAAQEDFQNGDDRYATA